MDALKNLSPAKSETISNLFYDWHIQHSVFAASEEKLALICIL